MLLKRNIKAVLAGAGLLAGAVAQATTISYNYTGAVQNWAAPAGVSSVDIVAIGAYGGSNAGGVAGGVGGYASGRLAVEQGTTLNLYVGGKGGSDGSGGYNGGAAAGATTVAATGGGGGGGASDVRVGGTAFANRVLVAGGGGGAGGNHTLPGGRGAGGGGGGGYFGGGGAGGSGTGAGAGSLSAGGIAGAYSLGSGPGTAGSLGMGGAGGYAQAGDFGPSAWAGGAGGAAGASGRNGFNGSAGGGGGGSSYVGGPGVSRGLTGVGAGDAAGNGFIQLTYLIAALGGLPVSGSILDLGNVYEGGSAITGGLLKAENIGEAGSTLMMSGLTGLDTTFALASGDVLASLLGDGVAGTGADMASFLFSFDPTGKGAGVYDTHITLSSNAGSLDYTLRATVLHNLTNTVPEPATLSLLMAGLQATAVGRRKRG